MSRNALRRASIDGAERAGTGICSGEGGMLPAEQAANSRYFYELASGKFDGNEGAIAKANELCNRYGLDTIGAGGGSIAWLDAGGMLQVGPESAGAYPGHAQLALV